MESYYKCRPKTKLGNRDINNVLNIRHFPALCSFLVEQMTHPQYSKSSARLFNIRSRKHRSSIDFNRFKNIDKYSRYSERYNSINLNKKYVTYYGSFSKQHVMFILS